MGADASPSGSPPAGAVGGPPAGLPVQTVARHNCPSCGARLEPVRCPSCGSIDVRSTKTRGAVRYYACRACRPPGGGVTRFKVRLA